MRIEDRDGRALAETTVVVDDAELIDLLEGLADVVEGQRDHLHFAQAGGPQLVVRKDSDAAGDPLRRQMDWWLGPIVLVLVTLVIVGGITVARWAVALL